MIPLIAVIAVRSPKASFRLWAPLFLIWLLLAPIALVLAPFAFLARAAMGRNPVRASASAFAILTALSGLRIEVDSPTAKVLVHIQ